MSKKKILVIYLVVVFVLLLIGAGVWGYHTYTERAQYNATYIFIDGVEYRRDLTVLDLSGQSVQELDKLKELQQLQKLDLRETGISVQQYEDLRAALPNCRIYWSVPFQGGFLEETVTAISVTELSDADMEMMRYLPELTRVTAHNCTDYEAIFRLSEKFPDLMVYYSVLVDGKTYYNTNEVLDLTDATKDEILRCVELLPNLTAVNLTGKLPSNKEMLELKESYPQITFSWDFEVLGVKTNSTAEFSDLSKIPMKDTAAVEEMLPYFYHLAKIDMIDCGLSNQVMADLNARHPETKFVWKVNVTGVMLRTDTKHFMPVQYKLKNIGDLRNLKYCTDMVVMDFGHYGVGQTSFLEYMPNLKYLLYFESSVQDVSDIAKCTSLKYLEIALSRVIDFWPLTNLTNLEDLNISHMPYLGEGKYGSFGDVTPLYQMSWLDRLWMARSNLSQAERTALQEALPNTTILFFSDGSTNRGWRQSPNYYKQRDVLGMWYMVH